MDVIGVGFGRTGTASMQLALERLGYGPCYHMVEAVAERARIRAWTRVFAGEPTNWDELFDGYRSTVDWPAAAYWRELVDAYPDAAVVLTVRDPQRWYDSMRATIIAQMSALSSPVARALLALNPTLRRFVDGLTERMNEVYDGRFDRDSAVAAFERHTREVHQYVPSERLLTFDVSDGWGPLCAFLGVPEPDEPFPRANDSAQFHKRSRNTLLRELAVPAAAATAGVASLLVGGALGVRALRKRVGNRRLPAITPPSPPDVPDLPLDELPRA